MASRGSVIPLFLKQIKNNEAINNNRPKNDSFFNVIR